MKNLQDGRKTNVRFRSADTIERVRLDTKDFQYLYADGGDAGVHGQGHLRADPPARRPDRRCRGVPRRTAWKSSLEMWEEKPISVQLPEQVEATIVEADAVVKGQTASSSYKPAVLENGVRVMVPPHIESGTRIVVDVYERTYVGKAG